MGVIAINPMLRAGYDVKLASGVITAGGTLGILIPPSVMIIVYAAVAGQSVVKLYAAAMFPGFFLALLYLAYVVGWALLSPKIAPALCPSNRRASRCPTWLPRFQALYWRQRAGRASPRIGLAGTGEVDQHRRARGAASATGSWSRMLRASRSCRSRSRSLTLWLVWWYVVIHPQVHRPRRGGPEALERRRWSRIGRRAGGADTGPQAWAFYRGLRHHLPHADGVCAGALLPEHDGRALRGAEAAHLIGDAAGYSHRRRARRDSLRHHHRHGIRRGRRGRRLPARVPCPRRWIGNGRRKPCSSPPRPRRWCAGSSSARRCSRPSSPSSAVRRWSSNGCSPSTCRRSSS